MKKGDLVYHKVHGLMEVKRSTYKRLGNKNVFYGTDELGKEHEIDDSVESPDKYLKEKEKKESPEFIDSMSELLSSIQGPQGEKGLDSDEEAIINSVIPKVLERIKIPENGKDGADADIELVVRELLPVVLEKMPKVNESAIIEKIMMRIKIPQDGKKGDTGKDGSPDTPKEIKGKLETLTGDERLDASAIKNLPKPIIGGGQSYTGLVKVDSTGTPGTLEDKLVAGSNITLTKTNDTISIASSGGVGGGSVDSVVAGNNIDVDSTDPANPIVSVETLTLSDISDVTASVTEINYVDGVTSAIQTQLNGKASSLGVDDNYVTDAQLVVIGNTSGTNTGDNATNTQYSGLAASKQDTLVSGTNIKTINSTSILGSGDIAVSAAPGGSDTQVQFNDGGALGGDAGLTYNKTTNVLSINNISGDVTNGLSLIVPAGAGAGAGVAIIVGTASSSDSGSDIQLVAGDGGATNGDGGDVTIFAGSTQEVSGGSFGGDIRIVSGYGNTSGGDISMEPGNGGTSAGVVKIYNIVNDVSSILNTSSLSDTDKTFTFPNSDGTFAITSGHARATAQTAANTNVLTVTANAADVTLQLLANVLVTTSTTHSITVTADYTDESNVARTVTIPFAQLAGTIITAITNVTGAGPYEGIPLTIRAKASTNVVFKTTGTFTGITYNVDCSVIQVATA